ncbi:Cysteine-rich PDZ-binding protein [Linum grandiflorum]
MVCAKCEKKLAKVIVPDKWKEGASNTNESGGRKINENKLLSKKNSCKYGILIMRLSDSGISAAAASDWTFPMDSVKYISSNVPMLDLITQTKPGSEKDDDFSGIEKPGSLTTFETVPSGGASSLFTSGSSSGLDVPSGDGGYSNLMIPLPYSSNSLFWRAATSYQSCSCQVWFNNA